MVDDRWHLPDLELGQVPRYVPDCDVPDVWQGQKPAHIVRRHNQAKALLSQRSRLLMLDEFDLNVTDLLVTMTSWVAVHGTSGTATAFPAAHSDAPLRRRPLGNLMPTLELRRTGLRPWATLVVYASGSVQLGLSKTVATLPRSRWSSSRSGTMMTRLFVGCAPPLVAIRTSWSNIFVHLLYMYESS